MRVLISLLFLIVTSDAQDVAKCYDGDKFDMLTPSSDGTAGRYRVRWCPDAKSLSSKGSVLNATEWQLLVFYDNNKTRNACKHINVYNEPRTVHSKVFEKELDLKTKLNCSEVCFYKDLDLVVTGCYFLKNSLKWNQYSSESSDSYQYISNNIISPQYFKHIKPYIRSRSYGKELYLRWYFSYFPVSDYYVELCKSNADVNRDEVNCSILDKCSAPDVHSVECRVQAEEGCYYVHLRHLAPWTHGESLWSPLIRPLNHKLCHSEVSNNTLEVEVVASSSARWYVWGGLLAAALLCGGAALAVALLRYRHGHARESVLKAWVRGRHAESNPVITAPRSGDILLLYARDGGPAHKMFHALYKLLQKTTSGKVYDIHSPSTVAIAGAHGADWLRAALARPGLRAVLVQTPAALCVGRTADSPACDRSAPLLGGARYRRPASSDAAAAHALRLLRDTATRHDVYNKYYVAQLLALETETVPQVSPFRRYLLPDGVRVLLNDLAPQPLVENEPLISCIEELEQTCKEFIQYVSENENYLRDELFFL